METTLKINLALTVLLVSGAIAGEPRQPDAPTVAEAAAQSRRQAILAEIKTLTNHPWAGDYFMIHPLREDTSMVLAPGSGFVFKSLGHGGLFGAALNYGTVTPTNGRLLLSFSRKNASTNIPPEYIPVAWGSRHYLIAADGMLHFCNEINQGWEPRSVPLRSHLLRQGD